MTGADLAFPPESRPVIAVLDAEPGLADDLALLIDRLCPQVRGEPGCLAFMPYRSQVDPGRFYIYEVYTDAAAFGVHLQTGHVKTFIAALPAVSTDGLNATVQLDVLGSGAATTSTPSGDPT